MTQSMSRFNLISPFQPQGDQPVHRSESVLLEFVSANPTGPLHVGHGRQAALGDVLGNILATQGWKAENAQKRMDTILSANYGDGTKTTACGTGTEASPTVSSRSASRSTTTSPRSTARRVSFVE